VPLTKIALCSSPCSSFRSDSPHHRFHLRQNPFICRSFPLLGKIMYQGKFLIPRKERMGAMWKTIPSSTREFQESNGNAKFSQSDDSLVKSAGSETWRWHCIASRTASPPGADQIELNSHVEFKKRNFRVIRICPTIATTSFRDFDIFFST
jgi:hypothetical protein